MGKVAAFKTVSLMLGEAIDGDCLSQGAHNFRTK
jgi:hypothetical protein